MKPADLDPLDFIRWAVNDPRHVVEASDSKHHAGFVARLRAAVIHSNAVVCDFAASTRVGQISTLDPEILLHLAQSARLPWPSALVQLDYPGLYFGAQPDDPVSPDPDSARHLTFLLEQVDGKASRVRVTVLLAATRPANPPDLVVEPIGYEIDTSGETLPSRNTPLCQAVREICRARLEGMAKIIFDGSDRPKLQRDLEIPDDEMPTDDQVRAALCRAMVDGRDPIDSLVLGREFVPFVRRDDGNYRLTVDERDTALRACFAALTAPAPSPYMRVDLIEEPARSKILTGVVNESLGTARFALALLIAFGLTGSVQVTDHRPRGRRMVGNRPCPYLSQSRLVIDLDEPLRIARTSIATGGSGRHHKAHPVRGFWRYLRKHGRDGRRDCAHHWESVIPAKPEVPVNPDRQACACGARRTWIRDHERGDASIGFVHHAAVEVVAGQQRPVRRSRKFRQADPLDA